MGTETDTFPQGYAHLLNPLWQLGGAEEKNVLEAVSGPRAKSTAGRPFRSGVKSKQRAYRGLNVTPEGKAPNFLKNIYYIQPEMFEKQTLLEILLPR